MEKGYRKNRFTFGLGTIGRDMVYSLISMYLLVYLTEAVNLSDKVLGSIAIVILCARVFDALNDPIMGVVVDNTRTRWGKFKPWILFGALSSGIFTILLFTDFHLSGTGYIVLFAFLYILWGMSFTTNDISYWSMMPSLSTDQKEREKIGALARIFANVGLFAVVVGIVPLTKVFSGVPQDADATPQGYFIFTLIVVGIMWVGQLITLFGVKEHRGLYKQEDHTGLKGMLSALFKNDQLLFTAISMLLFMIGYMTTTGFGLYFFKYAYRDENMYSIFALVLGVAQILALLVFPIFSKRYSRKTLYTAATIMVVAGYILFFFSPMNMIPIGIAGLLLFFGEAFIQLLMLMFLADSIEYGQWKLGKRNESVTFAVQPFINKGGGALGSFIVAQVVIFSGINSAVTPDDVTNDGLLLMKLAMFALPLLCIVAGYIVYMTKFKIDKKFFDQIVGDLKQRGDIHEDA